MGPLWVTGWTVLSYKDPAALQTLFLLSWILFLHGSLSVSPRARFICLLFSCWLSGLIRRNCRTASRQDHRGGRHRGQTSDTNYTAAGRLGTCKHGQPLFPSPLTEIRYFRSFHIKQIPLKYKFWGQFSSAFLLRVILKNQLGNAERKTHEPFTR